MRAVLEYGFCLAYWIEDGALFLVGAFTLGEAVLLQNVLCTTMLRSLLEAVCMAAEDLTWLVLMRDFSTFSDVCR